MPLAVGGEHDHGARATDPEHQAVAATVKLYFQGHATGNGDFFRKAFHPDARLFWICLWFSCSALNV